MAGHCASISENFDMLRSGIDLEGRLPSSLRNLTPTHYKGPPLAWFYDSHFHRTDFRIVLKVSLAPFYANFELIYLMKKNSLTLFYSEGLHTSPEDHRCETLEKAKTREPITNNYEKKRFHVNWNYLSDNSS